MKQKKGFTLVELLVVIAIIGLLSTLAVVALGSARAKARDARRISDVKQIQTALELYFGTNAEYPVAASAIVLGSDDYSVLSDAGFTDSDGSSGEEYMSQVPLQIPAGLTTLTDYTYIRNSASDYTISFEIETDTAGLAGETVHTASPGGIQ